MIEVSVERQVRRGLAWSTLNNVALRGGSFAVGIVLARLLTPHEFGVFAVALTVQAILITVADLGLSADIIRHPDPDSRAPTVGALGLASGVLLACLMATSASALAAAMGSPQAADTIAVLSITVAMAGAGVVPWAYLQRRFDQRAMFLIAVVDFVISTSVTIGLVLAGWGPMALAVGRVLAQLVAMILQFALSGTRPRYRIDRDVARSVLIFGGPLAMANMLSWALLNIDNVVISRVGGATMLGFYVLAFNISNWPMSVIGQVVRSVALPAFARTDGGSAELERGVALAWGFALPAGAALAALASPVVLFVYGDKWSATVPVLMALGLFGAMRVLFDVIVAYLLARGSSTDVLIIQVLWFLTLIPALIIGTQWFGIAGGGWAHLVVAVLAILPAYAVALRRVGVPLRVLIRAGVPPVLAALPAGVAGHLLAASIGSVVIQLVVGAAAGGIVYFALLGRWLRGHAAGAGVR